MAFLATTGSTASAHAVLLSTSPGASEVLPVSPTQISLHFSEPVEVSTGAVRVLDTFGAEVDVGRARHAPGDDTTVVVEVPELANGGYAVGWKVVSADGHPVDGAFTFSVGSAAQPGIDTVLRVGERVGGGDGWAGTGLSVARALLYAGLALLLGTWVFLLACWQQGRRDGSTTLLLASGGTLVVLASLARVALQSRYVDATIADVVDTSTGRAWVGAAAGGLAVTSIALALHRRVRSRAQLLAMIASAALLGFIVAQGGHATVGRWAGASVLLTVVHVVAMSTWIGGLVALLVCLRRGEPDDGRVAARRFSQLALVAVSVLVVTGTAQGLRQIEHVDDVAASPFGRVLLLKLALVALLVVVAILSRRIARGSDAASRKGMVAGPATDGAARLRRSVVVEVCFALAVIGATGQLAGASPLVDRSGTVDVALVSGNQIAYVTITPALTGLNQIHVTLASAGGTALAPDEITIRLSPVDGQIPPIDVPAVLIPPAHVTADATSIPFAGRWHLEVNARYGEFELVTFGTDFTVD